ncbi:MFS transporter [Calothrix rhizosoleniae]|uniref:MFS transporter n=1 Tax=Calothrix rhizosoleniae TaxID=888997 RepID=UPI000B49CC7E|nr:MFS transporter [Calothrix rhizosoleniae]
MHSVDLKTAIFPRSEQLSQDAASDFVVDSPGILIEPQKQRVSKSEIRTSLKASTADGIFAAMFTVTTSGILLSNFLVELDASPVEIGMLASIPMIVNLLQPLGAYFSERMTSRHSYCLWTHGAARLLWLILAIAILTTDWINWSNRQLVLLTLVIILASHFVTALGSASWLSWMAIIVPRRLRGRYFGIRNSVSSLTNLLFVPIAGVLVSLFPGGTIQGYGVVLILGILAGLASLACQFLKVDVNPQQQNVTPTNNPVVHSYEAQRPQLQASICKDTNFLMYLLYFGLWTFAFNLSTPFFNLYMLDTLDLDVSLLTLYGSIQAGTGMLMLIWWGRLADKIGNRMILFLTGILVAITPILWVGISNQSLDIWLWLPLLHILIGGTITAIELCTNNMQIAIAPIPNQSVYFAIAAAVAGGTGALGATIGGLLAENPAYGGLVSLFIISVGFRLIALVPLIFVQEASRQSFSRMLQNLAQRKPTAFNENTM